MVVVAIVGGTGNVGRTLTEAFVADGTHEVLAVARKEPTEPTVAPLLLADYTSIPSLTQLLTSNKIHTVISTLSVIDPTGAQSERNVVAAASASPNVKRFIASNWGTAAPSEPELRLPFNDYRDASIAALRETDLEWSQIHNSLFLDYFGMPHVPTRLTPIGFAVDIENKRAALPGTGDNVMALTYTYDLAKFVVASLTLENWDEEMWCYSDFATLKDIVGLAEKVTGSPFITTHDPLPTLTAGTVTELPSHKAIYQYIPQPFLHGMLSRFGLWTALDLMVVPKKGSLNEKFPEIRTMSVGEAVGAWEGK